MANFQYYLIYRVGKTLEKEKTMRSAVCDIPHIMAWTGCSDIWAWYKTKPTAALVAAHITKVVHMPISSIHAAENLSKENYLLAIGSKTHMKYAASKNSLILLVGITCTNIYMGSNPKYIVATLLIIVHLG